MKRFKRALTLAVATAFIALVPTAAAQADPFHLDLTDAVMDLGDLKDVKAIDSGATPPDPPATLDGTITDGAIEVPIAGFVFPPKEAEVSPGTTATINMEANQDITGTFDSATGAMEVAVSLKATVTVFGSDCVISPIDLNLTTGNFEPFLGEPFATGVAGPGAITGAWASLPPVTGGGTCGVVGQLIAGPGGIWMSQDIPVALRCETDPGDPRCVIVIEKPTAKPRIISGPDTVTNSTSATFTFTKGAAEEEPVTGYRCSLDGAAFEACDGGTKSYNGLADGVHTFKVTSFNEKGTGPEESRDWTVKQDDRNNKAELGSLNVKPKNKAIKRGKKATLTATISNVGSEAASGVKICVKAPKKLVSVKKCQTIRSIAAGGTGTAKFKVTVKKKAKKGKKATLKFTASGKDLGKKTATAKVKVK